MLYVTLIFVLGLKWQWPVIRSTMHEHFWRTEVRKCGVERYKQRLSQLSVVGRFQDQCLSSESTLCLLSLQKKRSSTVVFLASSFAGQNIQHVSSPVCVHVHLRTSLSLGCRLVTLFPKVLHRALQLAQPSTFTFKYFLFLARTGLFHTERNSVGSF